MKKTWILFILILCILPIMAQQVALKNEKVFEIKAGKVEYAIEGKTKGTKTLWFDDYGRVHCELKKTSTKMFGMTTKEETLTIRNKEWMYNINLIDKTGTKMSIDDAFEMSETIVGTTDEQELKEIAEDVKETLDAKDAGTETILGRNCIVMDINRLNGRHWRYKGVTLKMEVKMGGILGDFTETATAFDENVSVPASKFEVPAGIIIQELTGDLPGLLYENQ